MNENLGRQGGETLYVASYSLALRLTQAVMAAGCTLGSLVGVLLDPSPLRDMNVWLLLGICGLWLMSAYLMLLHWRSRVYFKDEGMLIAGPVTKAWRWYGDLVAFDYEPNRVDLRFCDGSVTKISAEMGDLGIVLKLLYTKAPNSSVQTRAPR